MASDVEAACCEDPLNATLDELHYVSLKSAGVHFPIYNAKKVKEHRIQFEIDEDDVSVWDFLFASTASFRRNDIEVDERQCPFVDIPEESITREKLDNGRRRITMDVSQVIIDEVVKHQCVVTTRPDP